MDLRNKRDTRFFFRAPAALLLAAACLLSAPAGAWLWNKYPVPVKAHPDWAAPQPVELAFTVPSEDIAQGIFHLLVDTQVYVPEGAEPEYFYHSAKYIANLTGVEQGAQIHIDYNPAYQSLRLHQVAVWRERERIDKLDSAHMSLINREKELAQLIYSGEQTLHLVLDDIRVGDILEYSYTLKGHNPIYEGIFAFSHQAQWQVPVRRLSVAVNWHRKGTLRYQAADNLEVRVELLKNGVRYSVESTDVQALQREERTPSWFNPYGSVRFSQSPDWASVADWARPLLESGVGNGPEIRKIAANIAKSSVDRPHRIAKALQYVQGEVRYYGIEIGANSHRPSKAEETLLRRYGDCKDKTVLLLSILRALGVEAYAALVNTRLNRGLGDALPAINMFDHVIVSVFHEGNIYWLDPSRQYQYGSLSSIHQPDYGYALVLKPGAFALMEATPLHQAYSATELRETFDLSAGPDAPALYNVQTTVTGLNAEKLRADLASTGRNSAQKDYLRFYKRFYPSIEATEPARFTDRPELNELEVAEKYSIRGIWQKNEDDDKHHAWLHAHAVTPHLRKMKTAERRHPLALDHPLNIRQLTEVRLHDYRWKFTSEDFNEENAFFSFSRKVRFDKAERKLLIEYNYLSKTDFVSPGEIETYIEAYEAVSEQSRYGIFIKPTALTGGTQKAQEPDYTLYVAGFYLGALMLLFAAWRLRQRRHPYTGETIYFPVALPKFALMWICTFGTYGFYWFYRNWLYVKRRDGSSIMPALRALFCPFWYYPLYAELLRDNARRDPGRRHLPPAPAGIALALAFCVLVIGPALAGYAILSIVAGMLLALPLANYIHFANRDTPAALRHNSRLRLAHAALFVLCAPPALFLLGAETGFLPGARVVAGDTLMNHNLKFLQRRGVIHPGDEIRYFYSDALLNFRTDGNGFSDRHVFAYWQDDGQFFLESANFDEIRDIKVVWGHWNSDTVIEVIRRDGSRFALYAAAFGGLDKPFVEALLERWRQQRPPETAVTRVQ
jgi:transglutaminase-like putative cysteine protease